MKMDMLKEQLNMFDMNNINEDIHNTIKTDTNKIVIEFKVNCTLNERFMKGARFEVSDHKADDKERYWIQIGNKFFGVYRDKCKIVKNINT